MRVRSGMLSMQICWRNDPVASSEYREPRALGSAPALIYQRQQQLQGMTKSKLCLQHCHDNTTATVSA